MVVSRLKEGLMELGDWPFDGKTIIGMNLLEVLDWADKSWRVLDGSLHRVEQNIMAMPPLQRSSVWRPKQVVDLWDSLIRGLPIGTFYLVKRPSGENKVVGSEDKTIPTELPGYDLLDGQQRIRALLVGAVDFPEEKRCLWVDLGYKDVVRGFGLHITSKGQPFGYDNKTGTKRDLKQRRAARERLEKNGKVFCKGREAYDHELFDEEVIQNGNRLCPQPPLPYVNSEYIFKLPVLLSEWRKGPPDRSDEDRFAALRAAVGNGPHDKAVNSLHEAFKRIRKAEVALLRVDSQSREDLLELFQRIGAGGTPLSSEERLYSIYKHHYPEIRDAVNEIHGKIGQVLPSTKIASTAIRIAFVQSAESKEDRNYTPDVARFSKMLVDERKFLDWLHKLIPISSHRVGEKGILLRSFETIKKLLWYQDGVGCFWIPEVLLASFPAELWQVLAFWVVDHPNTGNLKFSREEAVRFALFWNLAVQNNEKAARSAFAYIKMSKETLDFPGREIYELFTGNGDNHCAYELIPSEEFELKLCSNETPRWRTDAERFVENGMRNELGSDWWWNGKKMLPWLQRDYIYHMFGNYVPLTDHEDDVPYDIDHLCPTKDWGDHWTNMKKRLDVGEDLRKIVGNSREAVGRGIGNLQLLGSSKNREYQDDDVAKKMQFILRDHQPPREDDVKEMANFAFSPDHRQIWRRVSHPGPVANRKWNEDRLKAFQYAVEQRAAWLYRRFYDDLEYDRWVIDEITQRKICIVLELQS